MLVRRVPSVSLGEVERDELLYTIEVVVRAQVSRLFVDENEFEKVELHQPRSLDGYT